MDVEGVVPPYLELLARNAVREIVITKKDLVYVRRPLHRLSNELPLSQ